MEDKAGNIREYCNRFVMSEANFRKIHSIMLEYANKLGEGAYVSIYIDRLDKSFYETRDIEKILAEENSSKRSIRSLTMEIYSARAEGVDDDSQSAGRKCLVNFSSDKNRESNITIIATHSSRDWCLLLVDELSAQVERISAGKRFLSGDLRFPDFLFGLLTLMLFTIGGVLLVRGDVGDAQAILSGGMEDKINFLVERSISGSSDRLGYGLITLVAGLVFFIVVAELRPLSKLVALYNSSAFYWGDMIPIHDSRVSNRSKILWGIVVAFFVSILASIVVGRLGG